MPAMLAPFTQDGLLDIEGLKTNVKFLQKAGCSGIVCNGSSGEAANLSREERIAVITATRETLEHNLCLVAGTGSATTRETLTLTRDAIQAGADAVLVITPFNVIPNKEGLFRHYAAVCDLGCPVILYNLPEHTGVEIDFDTIERLLASCANIVGMKESSGDLTFFAELMRRFGDRMMPITGADTLFFQTTLMGSTAAILALGNIAPEAVIKVMRLCGEGKIEEARRGYYKLVPIARIILEGTNFPSPLKEAVRQLGRPAGAPRMPTLPVDARKAEEIRNALEYAGLL